MAYIIKDDINHEDWMSCLPEKLWDVPLTHLSIPGSHDAMSYCLDITSPLLRSESDTFRLLDGVFCCFTRPAIRRWATTQVQNIVEQLAADDLAIKETLQTVASWLKSHPKEIIILACSHFEGLNYKMHEEFIYSLKKIFGSKLCPRNTLLTLRSLWTSGYQVVLSYEDQSASRHKELWPAIPYLWANKPNAEELIYYLECQKQLGRPQGFFVAGLNLTTDRCFIASHPRVSLRTLTMENWNQVKKWLEDQKPGAEPTCLNIIAGDFIGPVPFCSLVITLNKKLL
uniref:Si:dkey-66a8.7 n=1 Tax=Cyprinus carpio TaxID=7962 RepID=A0A8C2JA49_CYPCA